MRGIGDSMGKQTQNYLSYMLRLWCTGERSAWKASLEEPCMGERLGFKDIDALCEFLRTKTMRSTNPNEEVFCESEGA